MTKINLLSEEVVSKIAAGEVIERPASVIKELIENSLDAGATKIFLEIKNFGKELIRISDNGEGMEEEDARKSILWHATSKISTTDDLYNIQTLGFRGEALASIAAVSRLALLTKHDERRDGFYLLVEGGLIVNSSVKAAEKGTTIEVRDIFFNTPARKKFLKSDGVELRHIIDVVTNYALINKDIAFKLGHENKELLHSPALEDWKNNIASIYGIKLAKELLEINYQDDRVKITGYVAKPYQARNDKIQQTVYVNGRWIKNGGIIKAVYEAFHSVLFVNKHPIFVLNLQLDTKRIDVNVHPHKLQIKIEQQDLVNQSVLAAVRSSLKKHNLVPELSFESDQQLTFKSSLQQSAAIRYSFEPSEQTTLKVREATAALNGNYALTVQKSSYVAESSGETVQDYSERLKLPLASPPLRPATKLPPLKIIGQIHKTFFVAETPGGVIFIDQHAAHERVLYEQFMTQFINQEVQTQQLLRGEMLECSPVEKTLLLEKKEELAKLGFIIENFGGNTFVIKTVPLVFGRTQPLEMVRELIPKLGSNNRLEEVKEEMVTRMACRAAVMAGKILTIPEIELILKNLEEMELPFSCPHGRPTMIRITAEEMEKKFRRK